MFDRTTIQSGSSSVSITENRAPTDKSIQLLKEFEEKAYNKLIDSFQCKINEFNGTVVRIKKEYLSETFIIKLNINGIDYNFTTNINDIDKYRNQGIDDAKILKERFSKFVCDVLLANCGFENLIR